MTDVTIYHNPGCGTSRNTLITPWGTELCRPSEVVLDILPLPQRGPFSKEDGEMVIDAERRRVSPQS
jgi:arsenate reductase